MAKGISNIDASSAILFSAKGQLGNLPQVRKVETVDEKYSENVVHHGTYDMFEPYPDAKLRLELRTGESKELLKESIRLYGIQTPIIVKRKDNSDKFIILAGHNRTEFMHELFLSGEVEKEDIPYVIKDLQEDEEKNIVIDSNFNNRDPEEIKPSYYAYALQEKRKIDEHQGKRKPLKSTSFASERSEQTDNDNTSFASERSEQSRWMDNNKFRLGKTQVLMYLKLNNLTDDFMQMADDRQFTLKVFYQIAFLSKESQNVLYKYIKENKIKLTESTCKTIRDNEEDGKELTEEILNSIFNITKVPSSQKLFTSIIRKSIPDFYFEEENAEQIIIDALKLYAEQHS